MTETLSMWRALLAVLKRSNMTKEFQDYLLMALNEYSFARDLLLDYLEDGRPEDLEAVKDLFLVKGLRINHIGGEEIPLQ